MQIQNQFIGQNYPNKINNQPRKNPQFGAYIVTPQASTPIICGFNGSTLKEAIKDIAPKALEELQALIGKGRDLIFTYREAQSLTSAKTMDEKLVFTQKAISDALKQPDLYIVETEAKAREIADNYVHYTMRV